MTKLPLRVEPSQPPPLPDRLPNLGPLVEGGTAVDERAGFLAAVLAGLALPQKAIPAKYFYDERGSALFEEICTLDEYYPTRTETAMLERLAPEIARLIGPGAALIEYGSGASRKIRALLDALAAPAAYLPVDISRTHLLRSARSLAADYPDLRIIPVAADYTRPLALPVPAGAKRVIFFPGSTIGNLTPAEAHALLRQAAGRVGRDGEMLVGVDLKKHPAILHRAYTDRRGVTADFNLNLLDRIGRELGGTADRRGFRHRAFYDPSQGRVEMHLVSLWHQSIAVGGQRFGFRPGETIHTESSYKYAVAEFQALARDAGFASAGVWQDADRLFSIHYLRVA